MAVRAVCAEPFDGLDRMAPRAFRRWWTERVRRTFEIAAAELPFYRERFAGARFDPASFRSLEQLASLPRFRKRDVLEEQSRRASAAIGIERLPDPAAPRTLTLSSGTAGTSFVTVNRRWRRLQGVSSARAHWWAGFRPGSPFLLSAPAWHSYAAIQPYLAEHFESACVVVAGTYLPRYSERIVDAIRRFRPRYATMFLPMVFPILAAGRRLGLEARRLFESVEVLVVTGAPITPGMRSHLVGELGVERIAEIAGSSEALLAVSCREERGLHAVPDTCHVDVVSRESGAPVAPGERGSVVSSFLIPEGSMYLRYDSEDAATYDDSPCPCGLPSPRVKLVGRWENAFRLGGSTCLPYDVQLALEEAVPEATGVPFVIVREGLDAGRLRLLVAESGTGAAGWAEAGRVALERRFDAPAEIAVVGELPLAFKGVAPVLSEKQVG